MSTYSRRRKDGTGSNERDLTGDVVMIRRTLASVNGSNNASDDDASPLVTCGGGRPAVAARMSSVCQSVRSSVTSRSSRHTNNATQQPMDFDVETLGEIPLGFIRITLTGRAAARNGRQTASRKALALRLAV